MIKIQLTREKGTSTGLQHTAAAGRPGWGPSARGRTWRGPRADAAAAGTWPQPARTHPVRAPGSCHPARLGASAPRRLPTQTIGVGAAGGGRGQAREGRWRCGGAARPQA